MGDLALLAQSLNTTDRTLRRAANEGLIRVERASARRQYVPFAEQRYLRAHWDLLRGLREALRTEPNVRLAVLFGSVARGDATDRSDVDIAVTLAEEDPVRLHELEDRLSRAVERDVQFLPLTRGWRNRSLRSDLAGEGRVLVDRDGAWPELREEALRNGVESDRDVDSRLERALAALR